MKTITPVAAATLLVALQVASLEARPVAAQPAALTPGETVIISWHDPALVGTSSAFRAQRFVVVRADDSQVIGRRDGRTYVMERRSIARMRRKIGTRPATAPEMVAGSAIGFATGFLLGAMSASEDRTDAGLSTGVLLGAPAGALVAWISSRSR